MAKKSLTRGWLDKYQTAGPVMTFNTMPVGTVGAPPATDNTTTYVVPVVTKEEKNKKALKKLNQTTAEHVDFAKDQNGNVIRDAQGNPTYNPAKGTTYGDNGRIVAGAILAPLALEAAGTAMATSLPIVGNVGNALTYVTMPQAAWNAAQGNYTDAAMLAAPWALGNAGKAIKALGTEEGLLSNAYKYNPWALKENPEMYLYRTQPKNFTPGLTEEQQLKNLVDVYTKEGKPIPWPLRGKLAKIQNNPEPYRNALNEYHGQWFDKDPDRMQWYMDVRLDNAEGNILRLKVPNEQGEAYSLKNYPEAQKASRNYETEFIVPKEKIPEAEIFSTNNLQDLINQHKDFNTPHWLTGYQSNILQNYQGLQQHKHGGWLNKYK